MDTYAMGMAVNTAMLASTATAASTGGSAAGAASADLSFYQVLSAVTGTVGGDAAASQMVSGMSWRDIQAGMMTEAMSAMNATQTPVVTDPVLAQLLQTLQSLSADGEIDASDMAALEKLIQQMQDRLREMLETEGAEVAGQQVLALMNELMPMLTGTEMPAEMMAAGTQDGGVLLDMVLTSSPQELLDTLAQTAGQGLQLQSVEPQVQQAGSETPLAQQTPAQGKTEGETADWTADVVQVEVKQSAPVVPFNQDFGALVREAKQQMAQAEETPAQPEEKTDIDALQQKVDSGAFLQNTALAQNTAVAEPAVPQQTPVATPQVQIQQNIVDMIQNGTQELSITLNPENLGEVTIQLSGVADSMKLNIIAKNPETQQMLANQIEMLRESLRPMKVEVDSVLTQSQFEMLNYQQSYDGQRRQQWQPMQGMTVTRYADDDFGEVEMLAMQPQMAPAGALNTYV